MCLVLRGRKRTPSADKWNKAFSTFVWATPRRFMRSVWCCRLFSCLRLGTGGRFDSVRNLFSKRAIRTLLLAPPHTRALKVSSRSSSLRLRHVTRDFPENAASSSSSSSSSPSSTSLPHTSSVVLSVCHCSVPHQCMRFTCLRETPSSGWLNE